MGSTPVQDLPGRLAAEFVRLVRAELTAAEFAEVRRRNATPAYANACATHDFRDANMLMHEAFVNVLGYAPRPWDESGSDAAHADDNALWNAAWEIARGGDLTDAPDAHVSPQPGVYVSPDMHYVLRIIDTSRAEYYPLGQPTPLDIADAARIIARRSLQRTT